MRRVEVVVQNNAWENNVRAHEWFPTDSRHSAPRKEALEEIFLRSVYYVNQN